MFSSLKPWNNKINPVCINGGNKASVSISYLYNFDTIWKLNQLLFKKKKIRFKSFNFTFVVTFLIQLHFLNRRIIVGGVTYIYISFESSCINKNIIQINIWADETVLCQCCDPAAGLKSVQGLLSAPGPHFGHPMEGYFGTIQKCGVN